jgi:hypothetical protein
MSKVTPFTKKVLGTLLVHAVGRRVSVLVLVRVRVRARVRGRVRVRVRVRVRDRDRVNLGLSICQFLIVKHDFYLVWTCC